MANQAEVDLVVSTAGALPNLERQLGDIVRTAEDGAPEVDLRASLRVQETIRSLDADLSRIAARAEVDPDNQIDIRAVLDQRRSLRALNRQVSSAIRATEAGADPVNVQASLDVGDSLRRIQGQLIAATRRVEDTTPPIELPVEIDPDSVDQIRRVAPQLGRIDSAARSSARGVGVLGRSLVVVGGGLAAVGGSVQVLAAVAAAVQQIAPAAAVATQGVLALQLATNTLKLAMIGVEDAVEAAFDPEASPEDLEKALKRLAPEARKTVEALRGARTQLIGIQQEVQNRFFEDFDDTLRDLGRTTLPTVRRALNDTATVLNRMVRSSANAASTLARNGTLGRALDGATKGLENLADVPPKVVTGFGQIAAAAAPAFDRVTRRLDTFASQVAEKLDKAFESGRLEDAIDKAIDSVGQLFGILGNFGEGLSNIFSGLTQDGGGLFDILEKISEAFVKLTSSKEFQSILKELSLTASELVDAVLPILQEAFVQLEPVIRELAPVVRDFVKEIGPELIPVIKELGPVLKDIAQLLKEQLPFAIDLTKSALQTLTTVLQLVHSIMQNFVIPIARKFKEVYQSDVAETFRLVTNVVGQQMIRMGQDFFRWRSSVNEDVNSVLRVMRVFVGRVAEDFTQGIRRQLNDTIGNLKGFTVQFVGAFTALPGRMFGIGLRILDGLVDGIQSQVGRLLGVVQGIADRITSTIANAMEIASPSKVTMRQGRFIGLGLVDGLLATAQQVQASAQELADIITDTLVPGPQGTDPLSQMNAGVTRTPLTAGPNLALVGAPAPNVNVFIGSERLDARIDFRTNVALRDRDRVLTQGVRRLG